MKLDVRLIVDLDREGLAKYREGYPGFDDESDTEVIVRELEAALGYEGLLGPDGVVVEKARIRP